MTQTNIAVVGFIITAISYFAVVGTVIYVAFHFILKYW